MSHIDLYFYAGCSSCRNAETLLKEIGSDYEKHEYFKVRFTPERLESLLSQIGKSPRDVLATRSRPFKELDLASLNLDDRELIDLVIEHPQLIKRPLTVRGSDVVVGYNKAAITALAKGTD
jgi:arsenate reductase